MHALFLLLLIGTIGLVFASKDNFGLDDWTPTDVQKWFSSHGLNVKIEDLEKIGITGHDALSLDEDKLLKLGVHIAQHKKYFEKSDKDRKSKCSKPADVFEFRACNLRFVDFWLIQALQVPDFGLLWARFYDDHSVVEKHNDEIDETPLWQFFATWIVSPSYPLYQIAKKLDSTTYVDEVIEWTLLLVVVTQIVQFIKMFFGREAFVAFWTMKVSNTVGGLVFAAVGYYGLYWVIPRFLNEIWFYLFIYGVLPSYAIAGFSLIVAVPLGIMGAVSEAAVKKHE